MTCEAEYINRLISEHGNTVLRIAYTYLKNMADAEDIVQDVFLSVIDKKPAFNDKSHEKLWLIRVTINMCKNKLNRFWERNKRPLSSAAEIPHYDEYNADKTVINAVMSLPEKYRIAVYMHYYEGYSAADIAKITHSQESTVRSLLHRARNKLKNILKEDYDFE